MWDETDSHGEVLGFPLDLNGDGDARTMDVSDAFEIMPVRITVRWNGVLGEQRVDLPGHSAEGGLDVNRRIGKPFTLVDVVIAATIVVIVVGVAYPGFKTANDTIATIGRQDRMNGRGTARCACSPRTCAPVGSPDSPRRTGPALTIRSVQGERGLWTSPTSQIEGNVPWATGERTIRSAEIETLTKRTRVPT